MSTPKKTIVTSKVVQQAPASELQDLASELALGFEEIQKLICLMGKEPIDELQLEVGNVKLHIRKTTNIVASPPAMQVASQAMPVVTAQALVSTEQQPTTQLIDSAISYITSPIVGTFYRAPSVNASAFVQPGDSVKLGQTMCIIEAMKLMNEIECDIAGKLLEVLVEDGQPVEYGERLFAIRTC